MIGFFIKKSFFDGWDNFLGLLLQNLVFTVLGLGALGTISYVESTPLVFLILLVLLALFSVHQTGSYFLVKDNADYHGASFARYKEGITRKYKHTLLYFAVVFLVVLCSGIIIPFYFKLGNLIGYIIAMFIFWAVIIVLLALMYYFPLTYLLEDDKPSKIFKKCFLVLGDNFGFSIFLAFWSLFNSVISIVLAFLVPGVAGVNLSHTVGMKLLMFKYDWLEENPEENVKSIIWEDLLFEEKEKVGNRTFKNMIFPWKD
ncbi:MAG: hypothetical protein WC162_12030 [Sphaerochaetaceae bacterium]|nr:hypothetical protein [Sphaerochaetaceae bacterium]